MALIFLRSGDEHVSARLALPHTAHGIDLMRPDLLLFRALGRCLVLWDATAAAAEAAAEEWMDKQMPEPIVTVLFRGQSVGAAGATGAAGAAAKASGGSSGMFQLGSATAFQAWLCVSAGLCLGLGIVHAGTQHGGAKRAILKRLRMIQRCVG